LSTKKMVKFDLINGSIGIYETIKINNKIYEIKYLME
jgi:hypothetical protein